MHQPEKPLSIVVVDAKAEFPKPIFQPHPKFSREVEGFFNKYTCLLFLRSLDKDKIEYFVDDKTDNKGAYFVVNYQLPEGKIRYDRHPPTGA